MRNRTLIVVAILAGLAIGSHSLLERADGRTFAGAFSAVLIALVTLALIVAVMAWARRR